MPENKSSHRAETSVVRGWLAGRRGLFSAARVSPFGVSRGRTGGTAREPVVNSPSSAIRARCVYSGARSGVATTVVRWGTAMSPASPDFRAL